jgi:hypothetical protein
VWRRLKKHAMYGNGNEVCDQKCSRMISHVGMLSRRFGRCLRSLNFNHTKHRKVLTSHGHAKGIPRSSCLPIYDYTGSVATVTIPHSLSPDLVLLLHYYCYLTHLIA